ncbi:MAG: DUF2306 domain-containing protein [Cyclobacteriaceae bacterium]
MNNLVHSTTGLVHIIAAIAAMIFGTIVLIIKKGTRIHRFLGYLYFYLMLALNGTAFMIYGLYGTFGPFHVAALLSLATLLAGFIPALRRRPANKWLMQHFTFMYFSIVGLFAAFASETLTRIPKSPFYGMVIVATITITTIGVIIHRKMKPLWEKSMIKN